MAVIGPSTGTRAERLVRMLLVRAGVRHRSQVRWGPRNRWTADFQVGRVLLDVHGHHWHAKRSKMGAMSAFWREKLKTNRNRDRRKRAFATKTGIRYAIVWEDWVLRGLTAERLMRVIRSAK